MEIQQARYVLALYEERNFSRAAKRCGVAQPSLSAALKRVEADLGGALFLRGTNKSREPAPTSLMLSIKHHIEQLIAHADYIENLAALNPRRQETDSKHRVQIL